MLATDLGIPETLNSIALTIPLSRKREKVLQLLTSVSIKSTTNFTNLVKPLEDQIEAALILARPSLAVKFVVGIQNLTRIKQGKIALIQVDPMDMFTYDALRGWGSQLSEIRPTLAAGRSLIIVTALPKGTTYDKDSIIYKEQISLSVASGAALAMQLVQIHLQKGGGHVDPSSNLFQPLRTFSHIRVPTLPSITFQYQIQDNNTSQGIFALLLFSLKPNFTDVADVTVKPERNTDIFNLIDIIRYPLILPQQRCTMIWPGDGKGPRRACCLFAPHDFESVQVILLINLLGFLNTGLIYLGIVHVYSHRNSQLKLDLVTNSDALTSMHILTSPTPILISASSGVQVYVKELGLSHILLRSELIEYLTVLREIQHENINVFMGCCVTPDSFSLVYEYCHRGCLQDLISNKSITFDWDFKLSLMTDFRMEYLHSTSLKAHGRLKSTNCVVTCRWVLKITDFGIPKFYNLTGSCPSIKTEDSGFVWNQRAKPYGLEDIAVEELPKRVRSREKPPFRPQIQPLQTGIPPVYRDILERAWLENPSLRPTFKELHEEIRQMTKGKKTNIVEHMFKMMENYSSRLEDQVRTRTEELEKEKRKKEILICRMLPPVVAEALKAGVAVALETYDEVSVYISDIVGFTTISAMSTPLQAVDLLNDLYTLFDKTIANYDVYKVETIGDAYLVASGLPVRNGRRHAGEVAMMALDLLSACGTFTIKHLPKVPLRLRIGLHSGPCVAGVVGLTMPR
uniref:guanylate cyclase n=1 Tax=Echinococcus granulosus TaxID=6210 RepID=A0A068WYL8_ECHGR|nr:retinal guanylyl cyclase 2 [Echinococcus granulosus]